MKALALSLLFLSGLSFADTATQPHEFKCQKATTSRFDAGYIELDVITKGAAPRFQIVGVTTQVIYNIPRKAISERIPLKQIDQTPYNATFENTNSKVEIDKESFTASLNGFQCKKTF